jgi:hypothetical protein
MIPMATAHRDFSPYYPPRARWYSPVLRATDRIGRALALDRLHVRLPGNLELLPLLAGFFVPGLAVWFRFQGLIGRTALALAALLVLAFLAFLGEALDNVVFGLLLALHASGFVAYCAPVVGHQIHRRLLLTLAILGAMTLLVYLPAQTILQDWFVTPLQFQDRVVIVGHLDSPGRLRAGDWIAYNVAGSYAYAEGGVYTNDGIDFSPVLAIPGDAVAFGPGVYRVNGVPHPALANMPESGSFRLGEKEWFVWPRLAIYSHHLNAENIIPSILLNMSRVTEGQLIGRPLRRWFWREQNLP